MKWLRNLFDNRVQQKDGVRPAKSLSAEQQQALCMSLQKLQYIALGATRVTLPDESPKFEISQQTARWAMPYAERILDAVELFQSGDIRGALSIFLSLPEAAIIQMNIGVCYMELGERQEAESWLNKSAGAMPPSRQGMLEENLRRLQIRK
jgi:tetratricopeptide (TPR) repeat protein